MTIKKISTNTVYSVEMTQKQLDKVYAILSSVDDVDTDKVHLDMSHHVDDASFELRDYRGDGLEDCQVGT